MSRPLPDLVGPGLDEAPTSEARLLVRLFGEPLGWQILDVPGPGITGSRLAELLSAKWGPQMGERLGCADGSSPMAVLAAARESDGTPFARAHKAAVNRSERCAVVICTRDNPAGLRACLESLTRQDHRDFLVWVVDNAPRTREAEEVVASYSGRLDVRYVVEPLPGLSRARNAAIRRDVDAPLLAWLDDDEEADELWLSEITRAFSGRPEVAAVSGVVVPAELTTRAQMLFEEFGGHSKGRGFTADEFSPGPPLVHVSKERTGGTSGLHRAA